MAVPAAARRVNGSSLRDPLLWIAVALYAVIFYVLGAVRYAAHRSFVDLGIFAQTAASAFGCFCNAIEGSHWAFHFSPILYVAGGFMHVWPSALSLVALQAVAGALTAPPVYGIVARCADQRAARLAALVVLLYPPLAGVIFNDFHENGLAPAAVAWLFWAFDAGYVWAAVVFTAVALAIKEDQAIFLTAAGAFGYIRFRHERRGTLALTLSVVCACVALVFFFAIQPHATHAAHWAPTRFYAWTGEDVGALFPRGIIERAGFLLLALLPLLFLPIRTPAFIVTILPLAEVLASRMSTTYTIGSHYAGAWAGYVFFAFALAIRRIHMRDPQRAYRLLYWCIALCVVEFAAADPLHPRFFLRPRTVADVRLDIFLTSLPREIDLATQEEAYTHLAATNPNATLLPEKSNESITACYILIDEAFPDSPRLVESKAFVARLINGRVYVPVRSVASITLYKRRAGCP